MDFVRVLSYASETEKSKAVGFELRGADVERLDAICFEHGLYRRDLLRGIVLEFLDSYESSSKKEATV